MDKIRLEAVRLVHQVTAGGAYSNILLNKHLRSHDYEDLDRRFLGELMLGTLKSLGTLDWYLQQLPNKPHLKADPLILTILRVALYQLLYLDKVPDFAAVNEAVEMAKELGNPGAAKFVNGVLRNFLRQRGSFVLPEKEAERLGIQFCHPKELVKKWLKYYGPEETRQLCAFNNSVPPLCLRVNTLCCSREELQGELEKMGVECRPGNLVPEGLVCTATVSLETLQQGLGGKFYIQDESSMLVAHYLDPRPGEKVLDMCAAPGGKTTHLAQLMQNQGQVLAWDIHSHKLPLIEYNARSLGISIITCQLQDATLLREDCRGQFDRVLVDAPCSGLGVLRRRAEARWRKKREDLKAFPPLQQQILARGGEYVKAGGVLVYSTCTIEQSENHYVVARFLETHPEFSLVEERQLLPQRDGVDGFYIAKLQRC